MNISEKFYRFAAECEFMAKLTHNPKNKTIWTHMAESFNQSLLVIRTSDTVAILSASTTGAMTRDNLNCLSRKAIDSCRANQQSLTILNSQNDSSRSLRKSARMLTTRLWNARSRRSRRTPRRRRLLPSRALCLVMRDFALAQLFKAGF
jgi:hypothetical protein